MGPPSSLCSMGGSRLFPTAKLLVAVLLVTGGLVPKAPWKMIPLAALPVTGLPWTVVRSRAAEHPDPVALAPEGVQEAVVLRRVEPDCVVGGEAKDGDAVEAAAGHVVVADDVEDRHRLDADAVGVVDGGGTRQVVVDDLVGVDQVVAQDPGGRAVVLRVHPRVHADAAEGAVVDDLVAHDAVVLRGEDGHSVAAPAGADGSDVVLGPDTGDGVPDPPSMATPSSRSCARCRS